LTYSRSSDLCSSREEETTNILGVSVEIYNNGFVGGEQTFESLFVQCVRMLTSLAENEEVIDINDSYSNTSVSENGSCCDSLESDFNTTSNQDDIGIETIFRRETLPYGCSGDTVLFSLGLS